MRRVRGVHRSQARRPGPKTGLTPRKDGSEGKMEEKRRVNFPVGYLVLQGGAQLILFPNIIREPISLKWWNLGRK